MKLVQYLGVIIELIGAALLIYVGLTGTHQSNTMLIVGLAIVIIGFISHIIFNKMVFSKRREDIR